MRALLYVFALAVLPIDAFLIQPLVESDESHREIEKRFILVFDTPALLIETILKCGLMSLYYGARNETLYFEELLAQYPKDKVYPCFARDKIDEAWYRHNERKFVQPGRFSQMVEYPAKYSYLFRPKNAERIFTIALWVVAIFVLYR